MNGLNTNTKKLHTLKSHARNVFKALGNDISAIEILKFIRGYFTAQSNLIIYHILYTFLYLLCHEVVHYVVFDYLQIK